jgi:hypothetical protein
VLVAFFTICIFVEVLSFPVEVTFLMLVVFLVLVVLITLVFFALDIFLLETTAFARSSKSRFLMPSLAVAELEDKSANLVDEAVLLVLFEN